MRIKKIIEKEKTLLSDIVGNNMLKVLIGEASKCYEKKNLRQNNQNQFITIQKLRGYIVTGNFNFTCMLSCT